MIKRLLMIAALISMLLCLCAGARAQTPYSDLSAACRDVRAYVRDFHQSLTFTLSPQAIGGRTNAEIRDILTDVLEGYIDYSIELSSEDANLRVTVYGSMRPALKLLRAWETGDQSALTADEIRTLNIALALAQECRSKAGSSLEIERAVYDVVCRDITYTTQDPLPSFCTEEYIRLNSSVGALLDGETTCLGYSEVFFLIGKLAGLDVDMQYGFPGGGAGGKHAWNTVRIGEKVYTVDTCWGDSYGDIFEPATPDYRFFNTGDDLMPANRCAHPEAAIAQVSAQTDLAHTAFGLAGGGKTCKDLDEAIDYALSCRSAGQSYAHVFIPGQSIPLETVDNTSVKRIKAEGIATTWGRMAYNFAGGTYIIYRWVLE
ncbi:MAG: hypothetical protein IKU34_01925 [Clostridia bacterium]|nr:hypothetical protein [Clostridia bacterium]